MFDYCKKKNKRNWHSLSEFSTFLRYQLSWKSIRRFLRCYVRKNTRDLLASFSEAAWRNTKSVCTIIAARRTNSNCLIPRYVTRATKGPPVHKSRKQQKRISLASPKLYRPMYVPLVCRQFPKRHSVVNILFNLMAYRYQLSCE
jgi:hypothetical protein